MLNHELKEYEMLVSKMLKKSPKKVGKNGVAVQGSMDLAGQDFVRALDEGRGMREEDLNERINDVADRFISVSTEEETYRAEAELKGLEAAQYYNKYIAKQIEQEAICLPSTSPANAAWSFERLVNAWKIIKL